MKPLDRWLQRWRIREARPWIPPGSRVLDIGCHEGELFRILSGRIDEGLGIDPLLAGPVRGDRYRLIPGSFPAALEGEGQASFDVITLLAVLEHLPAAERQELPGECARRLVPGGRVVITVPSRLVDRVLEVLLALRLIDGMSLEEHHGFEPGDTPRIFEGRGLRLLANRRFQLGLNHLYVFCKEGDRGINPRSR